MIQETDFKQFVSVFPKRYYDDYGQSKPRYLNDVKCFLSLMINFYDHSYNIFLNILQFLDAPMMKFLCNEQFLLMYTTLRKKYSVKLDISLSRSVQWWNNESRFINIPRTMIVTCSIQKLFDLPKIMTESAIPNLIENNSSDHKNNGQNNEENNIAVAAVAEIDCDYYDDYDYSKFDYPRIEKKKQNRLIVKKMQNKLEKNIRNDQHKHTKKMRSKNIISSRKNKDVTEELNTDSDDEIHDLFWEIMKEYCRVYNMMHDGYDTLF